MRVSIGVVAFALVCGACNKSESGVESTKAPISEVSIAEVTSWLEKGSAIPVDANSDETREKYGTLPHARLLSSSSTYDVEKELPADKNAKLVFYCGNTHCTASDAAASRAREAGYRDVHVMREGIMGWHSAGKPTNMPSKT